MTELPTSMLIRFLECTHSSDVPSRYIRLMAAEILQYRGEYHNALNEIRDKWEKGVKEMKDG